MDGYWLYILFAFVGFLLGIILRGRSSNQEVSKLKETHKIECDRLKEKNARMRGWIKGEVLRRQRKAEEAAAMQRADAAKMYPPEAKVNFRDPNPFSLFYNFQNEEDPFALPPGVTIDKDAFLVLGHKSKAYPYGNYTVFITPGTEVYHTLQSCRDIRVLYPENIMRVVGTRRPCAFCGHGMPKSNRLPKWYTNFRTASMDMDIEW